MKHSSCDLDRCSQCISHFVCTCLEVTEAALIDVIVSRGISDLRELRVETGAGDGCMACRRRLQHVLDEYSTKPAYHERIPAVALEVVSCG